MIEALGQMDDVDRDILIQRHFEGLNFEQIAAIQGCKREKARTLYNQASKRLLQLLEE
jgi:DNA-directed RNA polymerase specialized sigma24 family protein